MNEQNNGFQSPTANSPEPPMRAYAHAGEQGFQHDTSGIDAPGEIMHTSTYDPIPSSERTESFSAARAGDTATMPTAAGAATAERPSEALGSQGLPPAGAPAAPMQASGGAYYAQPSAQASNLESGYASQMGTRQAYSRSNVGPSSTYDSTSVTATTTRPSAQKSSGGAGKTFLFGFLGALLACALCIGGAMAFGLGKSPIPTNSATTTIGTTDQSVINAVDEGKTLAEAVAAKALPSVVAIYNYQNQATGYGYGFGYGYGASQQGEDSLVATGMGSGVVISDDGYIITNYHVVEDAAKLTVSVNGVERDATYVGGDISSDIAVIKVEDTEGLVAADIGDSDDLRIGEWVMTVGAPLGLESSVATGVVSATNRSTIMNSSSNGSDLYGMFYGNTAPQYTYYPNMIQTDAVINPGNSGGALVDANGKLIGINAMISSYSGDYAGVGFAIPVNYAIQIAQTVIEGKEPTHAMIGASLSQVNSTIAQQYNLSATSGAYVASITPDSGAAKSDLQIGDIITKVDGKKVASPTDVTLEVRAHKVGDTIKLTVNRNGEEMDIDVVLSSDEDIASASSEDSNGQEQGRGDGQGQGQRGNGYTPQDLEELLKMLGM